jgi:hypothetical protein
MFRKVAFALAATAAIGAAALAPTAASAHHFGPGLAGPHPHFAGPAGHYWGPRWPWGVGIATGLVGGAIVADSCVRPVTFQTPYGWRTRWVNVCY